MKIYDNTKLFVWAGMVDTYLQSEGPATPLKSCTGSQKSLWNLEIPLQLETWNLKLNFQYFRNLTDTEWFLVITLGKGRT